MTVNPKTGYLESPSPNFASFDSAKKVEFIRLALEQAKRGEWPDLENLCDQFQINYRTFTRHIEQDPRFSEEWELVKRSVAHDIARTMHVHSKRPGNYMDRVTLLRHLYPEEWGGEAKVSISADMSWIKKINDAISGSKPQIIATEAVITSTPKPTDAL